ncbi:MAG: hypothetical protein AABZ34_08835, partial [Nitrospirota bacterium]
EAPLKNWNILSKQAGPPLSSLEMIIQNEASSQATNVLSLSRESDWIHLMNLFQYTRLRSGDVRNTCVITQQYAQR